MRRTRHNRRVARRILLATEAADLARLLREISRWYREQTIEADIARSGLTIPQVSAVSVLYERGPMSLKDLSRELALSLRTNLRFQIGIGRHQQSRLAGINSGLVVIKPS